MAPEEHDLTQPEGPVVVRFLLPRSAPGYLKRVRKAMEIDRKRRDPNAGPEVIDEMVEYLLPFVAEPEDREAAREALWEMSEEQYDALMALTQGKQGDLPLASESTSSAT